MSFKNMKREELFAVADAFGTEVDGEATKAEIEAALVEDGITWETYKKFSEAEADEEVTAADAADEEESAESNDDSAEEVLLKMVRNNAHYEVRGYKFTRTHPYAIVKEDDADYLIDEIGGFRIATPREAKEFYN